MLREPQHDISNTNRLYLRLIYSIVMLKYPLRVSVAFLILSGFLP
jgi:hypothetical protein